jgi:allantoate deiminase
MINIQEFAQQVMQRCDELATCTETPDFLTRTFLSTPMQTAHALMQNWMEQAGLKVHIDAVGNIIGRKVSQDPNAKVFLIGSHLDTVKNAGKYDGMLGVLLGIALAEVYKDQELPFHLDIIGFSEEEGVRFAVPFIGSKAIAGMFDKSMLELTDSHNISVAKAIHNFGLNPEQISQAAYETKDVLGYLEVHIEQGPRLAAENQPIGMVTAIVGATRAKLSLTGLAGHAGTSPMHLRKDALAGAAELILAVETYAKTIPDLVATVGRIEAKPGAGNVIAGDVELSLDIRHIEDSLRHQAVQILQEKAETICKRRGLELRWQTLMDQAAVPMSDELTKALTRAAGHHAPLMPSGAGHDAMIMASLTPSAMLFIRSPNGISHHPDELVLVGDVEVALEVVVKFTEGMRNEE